MPRGAENPDRPDPSEDGSPAGEAPGRKGDSHIESGASGNRKSGGVVITGLRAPLDTFLERFSLWNRSYTAIWEANAGLQECVLAFPSQTESARNAQEGHRPCPQATEDSPPASYSLQDNGTLFPSREQASRARGFGKSESDLASSIYLLGPVHELKQQAARPHLAGLERVLQQQRGSGVSAARKGLLVSDSEARYPSSSPSPLKWKSSCHKTRSWKIHFLELCRC